MAALLLHWLVLEQLVPSLKHEHVAAWSDNTPTVSWANRLNSTKSKIANRLVMALAIRQRDQRASPLATLSMSGIANTLADKASRSFGKQGDAHFFKSDAEFLTHFQHAFPLPQNKSWQCFRPSSKLKRLVNSELLEDTFAPESWRRITKKGGSIGGIGNNSPATAKWTHVSKERQTNKRLSSSLLLLNGLGKAFAAEEKELELAQCNSASARLARPLHWLDGQTHSTKTQTDA